MIASQLHSHIYVDDVSTSQRSSIRHAVNNHLIYGCTNAFRESAIIQGRRVSATSNNRIMDEHVYVVRSDA